VAFHLSRSSHETTKNTKNSIRNANLVYFIVFLLLMEESTMKYRCCNAIYFRDVQDILEISWEIIKMHLHKLNKRILQNNQFIQDALIEHEY